MMSLSLPGAFRRRCGISRCGTQPCQLPLSPGKLKDFVGGDGGRSSVIQRQSLPPFDNGGRDGIVELLLAPVLLPTQSFAVARRVVMGGSLAVVPRKRTLDAACQSLGKDGADATSRSETLAGGEDEALWRLDELSRGGVAAHDRLMRLGD